MNAPSRLLVATIVLPLAFLSGCSPEASPVAVPPVENQSTPAPTAEAVVLPDDAVMAVSASATAANGARLDLQLVVHEPRGWNDAQAAAAQSRLLEWCDGEMDPASLKSGNFSLVQVSYSATLVGDTEWPASGVVWLHPTPEPAVLAGSGSVAQVELGVDPSDPGAYVPHCVQNATLPGAGEGVVYLGLENDLAGTEFGAPGPGWHEDFEPGSCIVGGTAGD